MQGRAWYDTDPHDQQRLRAVACGIRPASAIEHAVGVRASDQNREQRLTDALAAFQDCHRPVDCLRPDAAGT
jgi:hypothetical protein